MGTEPKQQPARTSSPSARTAETAATVPELSLPQPPGSSPASAAEVDLSAAENRTCLCSHELQKVKRNFLDSLPTAEEIANAASALRGEPAGASAETTTAQGSDETLFNQIGSLISRGYHALVDTFKSATASLLDSVAKLKEDLEKESLKPEDLRTRFSEIDTQVDEVQRQLEIARKQMSPEEYQRFLETPKIKAVLSFLNRYQELRRRTECQGENIDQEFQQSGVDPNISSQSEQLLQRLQSELQGNDRQLQQRLADSIRRSAEAFHNGESMDEFCEDALCDIRRANQQQREAFERFAEAESELAESSGDARLAARVRGRISAAHFELVHLHRRLDEDLDKCQATLFPDGWQHGQSLEYYLQNPGSIFAAFTNQYDLAIMRRLAAERAAQYQVDAKAAEPVKPQETGQSQVPEGFRSWARFIALTKSILPGALSAEAQQEARKQAEDDKRAEQLAAIMGKAPVRGLDGEVSASQRLDVLQKSKLV